MTVFAFLWRKHVQFVQNNACHNARNLVDRSVQPPDLPSLLKLGPISPNFELRRFTKLDLFSSKTLEWGIGLLQLRRPRINSGSCLGRLAHGMHALATSPCIGAPCLLTKGQDWQGKSRWDVLLMTRECGLRWCFNSALAWLNFILEALPQE
jgi:hypothetical protein